MKSGAEDWDEVSLADFGEVVAGGTPSRAVPSFWGGAVPWITPGEIKDLDGKYVRGTREKITGEGLAASAAKLLPVGSLLVTTRATLGETVIAAVPLATNQGFKNIILSERTDSLFAYYRLKTLLLEIQRLASGTTFLEISKADFSRIRTRRPSLEEQSRIATILDTTDEALANTKALIAKLKQVRAGLVQDLMTRGLDENGQLRDPVAHPEQFQDSTLGHLPNAWRVRTLEESCSDVVDCPHSTPNFCDTGVLVARTMHIKDGRFEEQAASRIPEAEYLERITRLRPEPGDVIFTREAPVGEAFVVPDGMRICLGQRVMLFRPRRDELLGTYLVAQVYSGAVRRRIDTLTGGTTNPHLNVAEVRRFPIPVPRREEQERIMEAISASEKSIAAEEFVFRKLSGARLGLIADLLTGRVRVPESLFSAEAHQ